MLAAILCGPTAVGKSALALRLAEANGWEIASADSRQIYRCLAIGTGAPTAEEQAKVPHHLVGFLGPEEAFSPREYPARVNALLEAHPEKPFLLVGGTGLYLKALLYPSARDRGPTPETVRREVQDRMSREGSAGMHAELLRLDPDSLAGVHPNDAYRIAKRWENHLITGEAYAGFAGPAVMDLRFARVPVLRMDRDRDALYASIDARVTAMASAGWLDEVKALMATHADWRDLPAMSSLGYREMVEVALGGMSLVDALREIRKKTRNYAKRQVTFFRHQLPTARPWEAGRLQAALEQCGWDWQVFRDRNLSSEKGKGEGIPESPDRA